MNMCGRCTTHFQPLLSMEKLHPSHGMVVNGAVESK